MTIQPQFGTKIGFAYQSKSYINTPIRKKVADDTAKFLADRYDTTVIPVIEDNIDGSYNNKTNYYLLDDTSEKHATSYWNELSEIAKTIGDKYFKDANITTLGYLKHYLKVLTNNNEISQEQSAKINLELKEKRIELAEKYANTPSHEKFKCIAHGEMPEIIITNGQERPFKDADFSDDVKVFMFTLKGWSFWPSDKK